MASKLNSFFLTQEDEAELSRRLKNAFPRIRFVNGQHWPTTVPPQVDSIESCDSGLAYLWNLDIASELPYLQRESYVQGPSSGPVMQFMRCRHKEHLLLSGTIGAGWDPEDIKFKEFAASVFKIVKSMNVTTLSCIEPASRKILTEKISTYTVGHFANEFANAPENLLCHTAANVLYKPRRIESAP